MRNQITAGAVAVGLGLTSSSAMADDTTTERTDPSGDRTTHTLDLVPDEFLGPIFPEAQRPTHVLPPSGNTSGMPGVQINRQVGNPRFGMAYDNDVENCRREHDYVATKPKIEIVVGKDLECIERQEKREARERRKAKDARAAAQRAQAAAVVQAQIDAARAARPAVAAGPSIVTIRIRPTTTADRTPSTKPDPATRRRSSDPARERRERKAEREAAQRAAEKAAEEAAQQAAGQAAVDAAAKQAEEAAARQAAEQAAADAAAKQAEEAAAAQAAEQAAADAAAAKAVADQQAAEQAAAQQAEADEAARQAAEQQATAVAGPVDPVAEQEAGETPIVEQPGGALTPEQEAAFEAAINGQEED